MNRYTYTFHPNSGLASTIPGIPGEFHAGISVDVDTDTMTVLASRLLNAPSYKQEKTELPQHLFPVSEEAVPREPVSEETPVSEEETGKEGGR